MKLVIDIPEEVYKTAQKTNILEADVEMLAKTIKNGIPLDKIKKEIDEQSAMHMDGEFYIRNFDVKWILEGNEVSP